VLPSTERLGEEIHDLVRKEPFPGMSDSMLQKKLNRQAS